MILRIIDLGFQLTFFKISLASFSNACKGKEEQDVTSVINANQLG